MLLDNHGQVPHFDIFLYCRKSLDFYVYIRSTVLDLPLILQYLKSENSESLSIIKNESTKWIYVKV